MTAQGGVEAKKKGVYKNLLSGGIAGSIARTIINPIERLEILRQLQNVDYKGLNMPQSFKKFWTTEGIHGIFKGNTASVARVFPFSALEFYFIEFYRNLLIRENPKRQKSIFFKLICGGLTGITATIFTYPLDVARTRLSASTQNSVVKEHRISTSLIGLVKNDGFMGLYKGFSIAVFGYFLLIALKQTLFDFLKTNYINTSNSKKKHLLDLYYGTLTGFVVTLTLYPFYLFKRVMQINSKFIYLLLDGNDMKLIPLVKDIVKTQGAKGMYRGMSLCLLKTGPFIGISFWANEKLKKVLKY